MTITIRRISVCSITGQANQIQASPTPQGCLLRPSQVKFTRWRKNGNRIVLRPAQRALFPDHQTSPRRNKIHYVHKPLENSTSRKESRSNNRPGDPQQGLAWLGTKFLFVSTKTTRKYSSCLAERSSGLVIQQQGAHAA